MFGGMCDVTAGRTGNVRERTPDSDSGDVAVDGDAPGPGAKNVFPQRGFGHVVRPPENDAGSPNGCLHAGQAIEVAMRNPTRAESGERLSDDVTLMLGSRDRPCQAI